MKAMPFSNMNEAIRSGYICHPQQLYNIRRVQLEEGKARGVTVIEVNTAGGLSVDILPQSGMDIGQVRFLGRNMSFISKNGYDSPNTFIPYANEFLHTFPGGLLHTCGLRNAGVACQDGTEYFPQHGRIHGLAAEPVSTRIEGDDLIVQGTLRETALFGGVLQMERKITIPGFGSRIRVEDTVRNMTSRDEEVMQLYHCNFAYPLISEKARLILPEERTMTPHTEWAAKGMDEACTFCEPVDWEEERVFFHAQSDPWAVVENPDLGVRMNMRWSGESLPVLVEWRSMACGDYVLGIEPANCSIHGRVQERERGMLPVLKGFEEVHYSVEIAFEELN